MAGKIRTIALAIITNDSGQFLLSEGRDSVKNETFYRPLGGGIEFGETGAVAVARELMEEIGEEIRVKSLRGVFENIFTYEGRGGHEIVLMYDAIMTSSTLRDTYEIREGTRVGTAVWRSLDEISRAGAKLYPNGLAEVFRK